MLNFAYSGLMLSSFRGENTLNYHVCVYHMSREGLRTFGCLF